MDAEEAIRKHALKNAFDYGKAKEGVVTAKVLGENTELKNNMKELALQVKKIVEQVNSLSRQELEKQISKYSFEKKIEKPRTLPDLNITDAVLRMAPNPNGPLHLGSARMIILNDEYFKKCGKELILRFDDTDPKNEEKIPLKEAYDLIEKDLQWLGVKPTKKIYASKRLDIYYDYFKKCIEKDLAYVCTCKEWKTRETRQACACRGRSVEENLKLWNEIGSYKEGEAVGRIKTDLNHPNPAIIDWVAFRIVDHPIHPLVDKSVKIWPTLDFASAIDDHELKVTLIIRGKDLMVSEERQKYIYSGFGWVYPLTVTYGKLSVKNATMSKSEMIKGIKEGVFTGFDDPKLPTLTALRRRGYVPQALREFILNFGLNDNETTVDWEILNNFNRKIIDQSAPRYFFVSDPVEIKVKIKGVFEIPLHPTSNLGFKKYSFNGETVFIVERKDLSDSMRLKGLVTVNSKGELVEGEGKVVQWVEKNNSIGVKILTPEKAMEGFAEKYCENLKIGTEVQFERFGFCRLDSKDTFYYTHV